MENGVSQGVAGTTAFVDALANGSCNEQTLANNSTDRSVRVASVPRRDGWKPSFLGRDAKAEALRPQNLVALDRPSSRLFP